MRIGVLVLSVGAFGKKGFYNLQEVGLAKALDPLFDEVKVYKLVSRDQEAKTESIAGTSHTTLSYLPSRVVGSNSIPNFKQLDSTLDVLVCFSDTQFSLPDVFAWTRKHHIVLLPYIGVLESHSTNRLKQILVNALFNRNLKIYKKTHCLVKTPAVRNQLNALGVPNISVAPVGLDLALMHEDFEKADPDALKEKYGFQKGNKVVLFVGRMIDEKCPVQMIEIFSDILKQDSDYRLLMVGSGPLADAVAEEIQKRNLNRFVTRLDRIPNCDIWELYCMSSCFVNLNRQEIFGMAILEAMYYGCKVVAWKAPGPEFIIENNISGCIAASGGEIVQAVLHQPILKSAAHNRVMNCFTWKCSAEIISGSVQQAEIGTCPSPHMTDE